MKETTESPQWDRWFRRVYGEFTPLLLPYAGQPTTYVEIGCWAGASAEWVAANVLTHPDSIGIGIDPYPTERRHPKEEIDAIIHRAQSRVRAVIGDRWQWIREPSNEALRHLDIILGHRSIDALYIDGDHDGHAVVQDFALAWPRLRVGSTVIFDDYARVKQSHSPHVSEGYHAILSAWGGLLEEVGKHRKQRAVKVLKLRHG